MEIINSIFLIFGVLLVIIGTSLIILHNKRKYLEKELTYKWSFNTLLVGILSIIGVITDALGVILLLGVIFGIFFRFYVVKKYSEKYNFMSFSIWEIIFFISIILVILIISAFYFN